MVCLSIRITIFLSFSMIFQSAIAQEKKPVEKPKLEWTKLEFKQFDKKRFGNPIIISFMRDLCPGCKAKRDALWSDSELIQAVTKRKTVLFEGNAAVDQKLAADVKEKFAIKNYPVVILVGKGMSDKPVILEGIPEPAKVLDAVRKHFPHGPGKKGIRE